MTRFWAALAGVVVLAAGCGGPITDDELERGIETLGSLAAEGELVARGVQNDRTKVTFTRVELRDLAEDAEHEAEKLSDAETRPENEEVAAQPVQLASDIGDALGELQVDPRNRARAADVGDRLGRLSSEAERLTGEL
jgi:predicted phage gp36 major capsid-like protein